MWRRLRWWRWGMREGTVDFSQVRVMVEEKPRMKDHRPAMVADSLGRINIIPTDKWPPDPDLDSVLSHESLHFLLTELFDLDTSTTLDRLPEKVLDGTMARAGVYGWGANVPGGLPEWRFRE